MLTSSTLCPAVGARPDRPSLLAAAAAAAMLGWPTLREARALGIPGIDRPAVHAHNQFNLMLMTNLGHDYTEFIRAWFTMRINAVNFLLSSKCLILTAGIASSGRACSLIFDHVKYLSSSRGAFAVFYNQPGSKQV